MIKAFHTFHVMKLTQSLPKQSKTQFGKKKLEEREPKLIENDKKTLLVGTVGASKDCQEFLQNLSQLKQPLCARLHTPVENPINDKNQIQDLAKQVDASLFVHISHTKKRPHNVVIGRLFNYEVMEQFEFELQNFISLQDIQSKKPTYQCKPILIFQGDGFENDDDFRELKSLFLDLFKGRAYPKLSRDALQYAIVFTANQGKDSVLVRSYVLNDITNTTYKQVESPTHLTPMGFSFNLIKRRKEFSALLAKQAFKFKEEVTQKKTEIEEKVERGKETDEIGRQYGTVHVGSGPINVLNLRKFKALDARRGGEEGDLEVDPGQVDDKEVQEGRDGDKESLENEGFEEEEEENEWE